MSEETVNTSDAPAGKSEFLSRFVVQALEGSTTPYIAWDLARAALLVGFVYFAATTSLAWLDINIRRPLKNERIDLLGAIDITPVEKDLALLRPWLPAKGKIGYLSEKPELQRYKTRLWLAPLLLDYDWGKYDLVLVDYPVHKGLEILETPKYQMLANLNDGKSFAKGARIYKRLP